MNPKAVTPPKKDAEKEKRMADMKNQIEDLKRKAEQASQKTQGEVLELELEQTLKDEFPFDDIDPVLPGPASSFHEFLSGADFRFSTLSFQLQGVCKSGPDARSFAQSV